MATSPGTGPPAPGPATDVPAATAGTRGGRWRFPIGPGGLVLAFPGPRPVQRGYVDQGWSRRSRRWGTPRSGPAASSASGSPAGCLSARAARGRRDPGGRRPGGRQRAPADAGRSRHRRRRSRAHPIADPQLPAAALHVWVDAHGTCTVAPYDGVPAELDREPLDGPGHLVARAAGDRGRHAAGPGPLRASRRRAARVGGRGGRRLQPAAAAAAAATGHPVPAAAAARPAGTAADADPDGGPPGAARRGHGLLPASDLHAGHVRAQPGHAAGHLRHRPPPRAPLLRPADGRVRRAQGPDRGRRARRLSTASGCSGGPTARIPP